MFSFVNLYTIKFIKASTAFSDGAVGRMRHLGTRPAPCGQAAPQPPTRCEDRLPSTAPKKTGSRGEDYADAKTHCKSEWHRTHSKEVEGCQEQDKSADMQTRNRVKLKAHGRNDDAAEPATSTGQSQVPNLIKLVIEQLESLLYR